MVLAPTSNFLFDKPREKKSDGVAIIPDIASVYQSTRMFNISLSYSEEKFHQNLQAWRAKKAPGTPNVFVIVVFPMLSTSSQPPSYQPLVDTVRDALTSPQADVVVYLPYHQQEAAADLEAEFGIALNSGQLQVLGETDPWNMRVGSAFPHLYNGMIFAYLLDLAYQSGSDYTLFLRAGATLLDSSPTADDYILTAVANYTAIAKEQEELGEHERTCWTLLSDRNIISMSPPTSIFMETAEHTRRLSIALRTSLPYNKMNSANLLDVYCRRLIWNGKKKRGTPLFQYQRPETNEVFNASKANVAFVNASEFGLPDWVDSSAQIGPRVYEPRPEYWIAFGVNTMKRPNAGTAYLEQFMKELLPIVENSQFSMSPIRATAKNGVIVLLACGNSMEEIATHRSFLETTYADAIDRQLVIVAESPLAEYNETLVNRRETYVGDPDERIYWRTKQNLDVAATIAATAGLSEFVMLLEDDTGFQPTFAASLNGTLLTASKARHGIPRWSRVEYGFGYSGILIHSSDLPVYEKIHSTFADEHPCDWLPIYSMIKTKTNRQVRSRKKFPNNSSNYLTHRGEFSTLPGKIQPVW